MKKSLLLGIMISIPFCVINAQWTDNGTYSFTTDNIGIGSSVIDAGIELQVTGDFKTTGKIISNGHINTPNSWFSSVGTIELGVPHYTGVVNPGVFSLIDFHYDNGLNEDWNVRLYNSADRTLAVDAETVGIGRWIDPSAYNGDATLYVKGMIRCEELKVALIADWPDFVFDADYELKSLKETEKFIEENHHLPGIGSAESLQTGGVALGEMVRL